MSGMGKALLILAILLSLGSAAAGYLLSTKKTQYSEQLVAAENALRSNESVGYTGNYTTNPNEPAASIGAVVTILKTTEEELTTTKSSLADSTQKLSDRNAEVSQLKANLASIERDLEETKANLTTSQEELTPLKAKVDQYEELLGGRDLQVVLSDLSKVQENFKVVEAEKRVIENILSEKNEQLTQLQQIVEMGKQGIAPLDLAGKVLAINKAWNFVVLDVGRDDQLPEGVDLTVYRGDDLVGKVRTVAVDTDTAIADIIPEWTQGEIAVGDQVLF
jgi:small-conductance mechanosensitive channel